MLIDPYRFGAAPPPGPHPLAYLFGSGELGAIYDAAYTDGTLVGAYTDVTGTTPATTDGQLAAYVTDWSGNANHLLQASAGNRPTFRKSGAKCWLNGDGTDDVMDTAGTVTGLKHFFAAGRFDGASFPEYNGFLCTLDSSATAIIFTGDFSATNAWYSSGTNLTNFRLNGSASILAPMSTNGVTSVEKTLGNSAATGQIRIFADRFNINRFWSGRMYGALLIDRILTTGERNDVESYFATII